MNHNLMAAMVLLVGFVVGGMDVCADLIYDESPYRLNEAERETVCQIVACEAGADSIEGQMMIAQCICDYAVDNGITVDQTVQALQISTYTREITEENRECVRAVFDVGERVTDAHAYWWYQPKMCSSSFHESQCFVYESEAGHRFFGKWN